MKNILLLVFVLGSFTVAAQKQPLLTILTYHGDVTLGGHPVAAGQAVYDDGRDLLIGGKGSYASILTETGYAQKLGRGNYSPVFLNNEAAGVKPRPAGYLRMAEKAAGIPIVSNYYQRLLKKYGMDTL